MAPLYKEAHFIDYDLPPEAEALDEDVDNIQRMVVLDREFAERIRTDPKYGCPFVAHHNYFVRGRKPKAEWKWSNTPEHVKSFILGSLKNAANLAMLQKTRLHKLIGFIEDTEERIRALEECNFQLQHVWKYLGGFKCFDNEIIELRNEIDTEWMFDPDIDSPVSPGPARAA